MVQTQKPFGERLTRVATLLPFPLSYKGGISTFVRGLTEAIERGFGVDSYLIASERFTARAGRPLAQAKVALGQLVELLRVRPDIVHTHEHAALLAAAIAYRALAGPWVSVVHTVHIHPVTSRALWKRLVLGWMLARCSAVTAVASATAARLNRIAYPPPEDVRIIHGAASIPVRNHGDGAAEELRTSLGMGDGPVVCQISPLNLPGKVAGIACLLAAIALVRHRVPNVQLLLVGGGRMRSQVEQTAIRVGVGECTFFTGYFDDVSVPLALTEVYCQITRQDACPLSLLEAMYSGKPIVASRTGGIPEVIVDGLDGLLVNSDPHVVAEAIVGLLLDGERARALGMHAAETARQRFTWERVAADFAQVYGLQRQAAYVQALRPAGLVELETAGAAQA